MEYISQPFISIIIPTYNVGRYIARCLESCINQTFSDIEILIVDDCGSDDSIKIAQSYAKQDSRIKIIHNEKNLGTFGTRIEGIKAAEGAYVAFLDADDYLKPNTCEKMLQHITNSTLAPTHNTQSLIDSNTLESAPDIIHFKSHYTANKQTKPLAKLTHYLRYILPTRFCKTPLHNEQIAYNFFLDSRQFPKFTLWDKCYKTSLVKKTLPYLESFTSQKLLMAEDMLKFFVISAFAKSYVSVDSRLYVYCLNDNSITQNPQAKLKKINDMCYIISALRPLNHSLESINPLMPRIAQTMSKDLAALIILESRHNLMHGGGGYNRIFAESYLAKLARFFTLYCQNLSSAYTPCGSWAYPNAKNPSLYTQNPLTISALLYIVIAVLESLPYLYPYFCLYYFYGVCQNLESTFAKVDSVLGIHSDDLAKFRATADSCSTLNFAKSPTSNTTIPRIFEEKQATRELSSRAVCQHGVAIHSLESTFSNENSRENAQILNEPRAEIRLGGLSHKRGDEIRDSSPQAESLLKLPKISLITTTFNSAATISSTLESILAQSYTDFEHIIIDNQSSDATLSIVESYRPQYRAKGVSLQVFSQRDLGIYDGMNKGLEKARGEIVGFLNADDFFASKLVLEFIAWGFDKPDSIDIVYANILYISHSMQPLRTLNGKNLKKLDFALGFHPPHPSFYAKKALYTRYGGFDLSYAIAADYEIMLRFLQKYQAKSLYIDECFVKMRVGGTSNANLSNIMRANFECARAWWDNGLSTFPIFIVLKPLRKILHRLVMLLGGGGRTRI